MGESGAHARPWIDGGVPVAWTVPQGGWRTFSPRASRGTVALQGGQHNIALYRYHGYAHVSVGGHFLLLGREHLRSCLARR